jgi:hypothetical protein
MKVEVHPTEVVIRLPRIVPAQLSGSGKSFLIATSKGIVETDALVDGFKVQAGVNVFIENPNYVKPTKK